MGSNRLFYQAPAGPFRIRLGPRTPGFTFKVIRIPSRGVPRSCQNWGTVSSGVSGVGTSGG